MHTPENRQVVIFGAGLVGSRALSYLREQGCSVLAFIDNKAESFRGGVHGFTCGGF